MPETVIRLRTKKLEKRVLDILSDPNFREQCSSSGRVRVNGYCVYICSDELLKVLDEKEIPYKKVNRYELDKGKIGKDFRNFYGI